VIGGRSLASAGLALLLACGTGGEPAGESSATTAPGAESARRSGIERPPRVEDVLLVTIDTLRADALGYSGEQGADTPVLDRLAEQGMVFTNAHAHSVVTLPSHTNILTGLLPYEHGVRENAGFILSAEIPTAGSYFGQAGFATGAVVGASPLTANHGLAHHFDFYDYQFTKSWGKPDLIPERPGNEVVSIGLDWWRSNADKRRFLWIHLYDPHTPYEPPEPFASRYPSSPYLGEVALTDAFLGPILEPFLEGRERPALVVFTSDHGEALGSHGELTHGFFAYEATLKVPLVLWAPGLEQGTDDRLVRHIDLLPTMLDAAGLDIPRSLSGHSLFESFEHDAIVSYLEALSANLNRGWAPLRGVVRGDHKLISVPIPELYDLASDPGEEVNLVQSERRIFAQLRDDLPDEEGWPPGRQEDVSAEVKELLLSLGYLAVEVEHRTEFSEEDDPKNLVDLDRKLHEVVDDMNNDRLAEAERKVREVIAVRPMTMAYSALAQILQDQNRDVEAVEVLETAVATGYAPRTTVRQLALLLARVGRLQDALKLALPMRDSDHAGNLNALGSILVEAGRFDEATEVLQRAAELEPVNPLAYESMALIALRQGRWQETRRWAEEALAIDEGLSLSWNYLGGALFNLGQQAGAVEAWERSVVLDPQNYDALFNLAVVAREIGDTERARRALRQFIDTAPPDRYGSDIQKAIRWHAMLAG
jgi:arylsulfatase A-like enzyme/Flp pilus assembly protein TadD